MTGVRPGSIAREVAAEFPGVRLRLAEAAGPCGPSPPAVRGRLAALSDRFRGAGVIAMRSRPVERAYRTFYRQIGLDPDVRRIPSEAAALERLLHGGFTSVDLLADARLIALLETGVPVWAVDQATLAARELELRNEAAGLMIMAGKQVVSVLFDEPRPPLTARPQTARPLLYALGVEGVPEIHVEEALWVCLELLGGGR